MITIQQKTHQKTESFVDTNQGTGNEASTQANGANRIVTDTYRVFSIYHLRCQLKVRARIVLWKHMTNILGTEDIYLCLDLCQHQ